MNQFKINEAKVRLPDLVDAALKGEDVFILKDARQMVQLVPVEPPMRQPQFGSARGLIVMSDDFDMPLTDFEEYTS